MSRESTRSSQSRRATASEVLAKKRVPEFDADFIEEAQLIFGGHQRFVDPRTGLAFYGPYYIDGRRRTQIRLGVI